MHPGELDAGRCRTSGAVSLSLSHVAQRHRRDTRHRERQRHVTERHTYAANSRMHTPLHYYQTHGYATSRHTDKHLYTPIQRVHTVDTKTNTDNHLYTPYSAHTHTACTSLYV
jgi:hypothetical protein